MICAVFLHSDKEKADLFPPENSDDDLGSFYHWRNMFDNDGYCLGATKRVLFVPDMKNIYKINVIYSNLQSYITNTIANNNVKLFFDMRLISNLSPDSSSLWNTKTPPLLISNKIESLYDQNEKNYSQNIIDALDNVKYKQFGMYTQARDDDNNASKSKGDLQS